MIGKEHQIPGRNVGAQRQGMEDAKEQAGSERGDGRDFAKIIAAVRISPSGPMSKVQARSDQSPPGQVSSKGVESGTVEVRSRRTEA